MLEANQVLDLAFRWVVSQKKIWLKGPFQMEQDPEFKEVGKWPHIGATEVFYN